MILKGVANCFHTYAGIQLRAECDRQMRKLRLEYGPDYEQPTAVPMLTDGYNLPARKVIHIVGPVVSGSLRKEQEKALADCYANTLDLCLENGLRSAAVCCISTGVFHFPNREAARIAVQAVTDWLTAHTDIADSQNSLDSLDRVVFNVFKDEDKSYYEAELR